MRMMLFVRQVDATAVSLRDWLSVRARSVRSLLDFQVSRENSDNTNDPKSTASENCSVCRDLLTHMERFFDLLEASRRYPKSDWLTVDEIAAELKVSKTIIYRLIRTGDIEAVNIVTEHGQIAKKGHYRIRRSDLDLYIESKRVRRFPEKTVSRSRYFPKVKNHLGL
jgi:excisionase family DNA binding protein